MHALLSLLALFAGQFAAQFAAQYLTQHYKNTSIFLPQIAATGVNDLKHDEEAAAATERFVVTFKSTSHNITASQNATNTSEGFLRGAVTVQPTEVAASAISPPLLLIGIIALLLCFLAIWHILKADSLEYDVDGCYDDHVSPVYQILENECWSAWMDVDLAVACYDWLDTYRRDQLQQKDEELNQKRKMYLDALEKKDNRDAWRILLFRISIKQYERRLDKLEGENKALTAVKWDLERRMSAGNDGHDPDERLRKESDEVLRKSQEILEKYRELLRDHQELQQDHKELQQDHKELQQDHKEILLKYMQTLEELRRFREALLGIPDDRDSHGHDDDEHDDLDPSAGPSNSPIQPEPNGEGGVGGESPDPDETGRSGGASPTSGSGSPPSDSDDEKKPPSEAPDPDVESPSDKPPSSPHTPTSPSSASNGTLGESRLSGPHSIPPPTMPRAMQRKELRNLGAPTGPKSMRVGFSRPGSNEPFNRGPPTNGYGNGYGPSGSFNRRPPPNGYGPRPMQFHGGFPAGTPRPVTRPAQRRPGSEGPQIPPPQSTTPTPDEVDFFGRPAQRRPDPQAPSFSPVQPTPPKPGQIDFSIEPGLKGWTGK